MSLVADKPRFAWRVGLHVAKQVCEAMKPACDRIIVAGSLRRKKPTIGDVEILYVSKTTERPAGLFDKETISLVDEVIAKLEADGILERRKNANGFEVFGAKKQTHAACGNGFARGPIRCNLQQLVELPRLSYWTLSEQHRHL